MPRLIDADKLWKHKFKSASERMDLDVEYMGGWNDAIDLIVENAPTVEAIPIEWFKKKMDKLLESGIFGAEVYQWVLNRWYEDKEYWEKENAE